MKKVCIIIINYNGLKHNEECINSILSSTYNGIEILIVDNDSSDGSIERLREVYKDRITIIETHSNNGFAHATNIGIKYADENDFDYVLLLNNDTIIEKDMIANMVSCSRENNNCVVSPKILYFEPNDTIWFAGGDIYWRKGSAIHYGMNEKDSEKYNKMKSINFATGCCILIPREVLKKVGEIPEKYFLYFEDAEYSLMIKRCGFDIMYSPDSVMYHKVSATTGGEESKCFVYYFTRARLYFYKKYRKMSLVYIMLGLFRKRVIWTLKGRKDLVVSMNDAIKDFIKGVDGKNNKY